MYKNIVPDWFKKTSVYQVNPRTFSREGTIKAVTDELPTLKELGFGIIYLCPIFKTDDSKDKAYWSPRQIASNTENPKNPYRMVNYFEIDEEYGSMADLKSFVSECHRLGLKCLLDLVYLHMGPSADILKAHPEFARRKEDGSLELNHWNFAVLNYENEGLREYLYTNMVYYVGEIGVDGFRCDVGDCIPLDFWAEGKRRIRAINPEAVMINEGGKSEYLTVFDANYGFYWHNCLYAMLSGSKTAKEVKAEYDHFSGSGLILRDMDNHDTVTDWPYRIEGHFGHDAMDLILAVNYTLDGVPMVYCGNELADTARLSMFANRFYPGEFEFTDRKTATPESEKRRELIRFLNRIKAEYKALYEGETEWRETENDKVIAFTRKADSERITFYGNFSKEAADIDLPKNKEVLHSCGLSDGRLSSYGYIIFKKGE